MRYIFLLLLIGASIGIFVAVILPRYNVVKADRAEIATYNANLVTATQLQQSRDSLITQYNNIPKTDLDNIKTLLPDSVDNIRLIIQLDSLATKNALSSLRNVDYNPDQVPTTGTPAKTTTARTDDPATAQRPYGEFVISFQTTGQYSNFLSFLSDLEQNLRLVDVTNIEFLPSSATGTTQTGASGLSYKVTLKTYWLKQ
jgi:hypothetical protein